MLYINISIEPEGEEEFSLVDLSFMRITTDKNENNEYKYNYGGSWLGRDKNKHFVNGFIYSKREDKIFVIAQKILADIQNKTEEVRGRQN